MSGGLLDIIKEFEMTLVRLKFEFVRQSRLLEQENLTLRHRLNMAQNTWLPINYVDVKAGMYIRGVQLCGNGTFIEHVGLVAKVGENNGNGQHRDKTGVHLAGPHDDIWVLQP